MVLVLAVLNVVIFSRMSQVLTCRILCKGLMWSTVPDFNLLTAVIIVDSCTNAFVIVRLLMSGQLLSSGCLSTRPANVSRSD